MPKHAPHKTSFFLYLPTRLAPGSVIQLDRHEFMVMTTCGMTDGTTEHNCSYLQDMPDEVKAIAKRVGQ